MEYKMQFELLLKALGHDLTYLWGQTNHWSKGYQCESDERVAVFREFFLCVESSTECLIFRYTIMIYDSLFMILHCSCLLHFLILYYTILYYILFCCSISCYVILFI